MRTVQATELKAKLSAILGDVERGETIVIERHGKVVGKLVPPNDVDFWDRRRSAVEAIRALKTGRPSGMTVEDILAARDEGRKPKAALTILTG